MDDQTETTAAPAEVYVPPMLAEVGEFSEDTLGFGGGFDSFSGFGY